jgi:hypothetical protein
MTRGLLTFAASLGVASIIACGAPNTGTVVAPTAAPAKTAQANSPATAVPTTQPASTPRADVKTAVPTPAAVIPPKLPSVYNVGDTIQVQDHTITVLSVNRDSKSVSLDIQINNTGAKDLDVSSIASFSAKDGDGNRLSQTISLDKPSLDGKVLPNDKLKGTIVYSVPGDAQGLKLFYTPSIFGSGAIVVALDDAAKANPFPKPTDTDGSKSFTKGTVYQTGDAVSNNGVIVRLLDAKLDGDLLSASFVAYNGGQKDTTFSSIASFDAKDGEGTKGSYQFMTDGPSLDGTLLPGDTLRGSLQWKFDTAPSGLKVYFSNSLFGGDTITWAVQ